MMGKPRKGRRYIFKSDQVTQPAGMAGAGAGAGGRGSVGGNHRLEPVNCEL